MARGRLKTFWSRPVNRFLVSLAVFLLSSWLCYHTLSEVVGPVAVHNDDFDAISSDQLTYPPLVVARFKPDNGARAPNPGDAALPLLAAEPPPATPVRHRPASMPTRLAEQARTVVAQADLLCRSGKIIKARTVLNRFAEHQTTLSVRQYAIKLGARTILSGHICPDDHLCYTYTVKPGDTLTRIAKNCQVPYQFICRINRITDPRRLRAGSRIKLLRGPVNAVVILHKFAIYLYLQDTLFARYDVAVGNKDRRTPTGTWLVTKRVRNPAYTDPDTGKVYGSTDPRNPTAGYWIAIKGLTGEAIGKTGFGIHGTVEPETIGKPASKGCIRMRPKEVADVFDMLQPGVSKVTIRP